MIVTQELDGKIMAGKISALLQYGIRKIFSLSCYFVCYDYNSVQTVLTESKNIRKKLLKIDEMSPINTLG